MPPQKITYLFVDGAYLRGVVEDMSRQLLGDVVLPVDYALLGSGFTKCFYYDCVSPQRAGEADADFDRRRGQQQEAFSLIRRVDGWHVFEGVMVGRGKSARQKQVDIQIAVDMLSHSYRRNMQELDFIAGDQDFKPLVDALVREGMYVRLLYERRSASSALVEAADARRQLTAYDLWAYAPQQFRAEHALPARHSGPSAPTGELIQSGTCSEGGLGLWRHREGFTISHRDKLNPGYFMHFDHRDCDFLKRVVENVMGPVDWQ